MIRFDYLRSARPAIVRRMLEYRLPPQLRSPLFALGSAALITISAWGIEAYRLACANEIEASYRDRFEQSRVEVSRTKVLYARVERLIAMAKEVRAIQVSGNQRALRFADIGNNLAPHVWLTSISSADDGFDVAGKARDFVSLSRTMARLSRARMRYAPVLIRAGREEHSANSGPLQYELHLGNAE